MVGARFRAVQINWLSEQDIWSKKEANFLSQYAATWGKEARLYNEIEKLKSKKLGFLGARKLKKLENELITTSKKRKSQGKKAAEIVNLKNVMELVKKGHAPQKIVECLPGEVVEKAGGRTKVISILTPKVKKHKVRK